jgi:hypothetical protein
MRHLNASGLGRAPQDGDNLSIACPATAGTDYGRWGGNGGEAPDLAIDQRREDGQSLCFDTEILGQDLTLLGAPEVDLELTVDKPLVNIAVRLCDVYPDGTSAVMTYGVLNLAHRNSHAHPEPCPAGRPFRATVRLNDFGRTVPRGHRIRLAVQNQFWFVLWPQPELSTITLASGTSTVRLPLRPPSPGDREVHFAPAEIAAPAAVTTIREETYSKTVADDLVTGMRSIRLCTDYGAWRIDDRDIEGSAVNADSFFIHPGDPLSARLVTEYRWSMKCGPADTSGLARTELTADAINFHLIWRIEAREGARIVFAKDRTHSIPRDGC